MPYKQSFAIRRVLAAGALAVAALSPMLAHAQFNANALFGKKIDGVNKVLGQPISTSGNPVLYAHYNTPGAVSTEVWYFAGPLNVGKVQIQILGKPSDTYQSVLKRYGLSLGSSPSSITGLAKPALSMTSQGDTGTPWTKVFISYMYPFPFKTVEVQYCKAHNLKPGQTYFWTIQISTRKNAGHQMKGGG